MGQGESPSGVRGEAPADVSARGTGLRGVVDTLAACPAAVPDWRCRHILGAGLGENGGERCGPVGVQIRMSRTADPHHAFSRAALVAAVVLAVFWSWKVLGIVLEHIRGDVGP